MWGTDATRFYTERKGWCWFFGAIDHHLDEVVGWHLRTPVAPDRQTPRHVLAEPPEGMTDALANGLEGGPAIAELGGTDGEGECEATNRPFSGPVTSKDRKVRGPGPGGAGGRARASRKSKATRRSGRGGF